MILPPLRALLLGAVLALAGCGDTQTGPIQVSAIGGPPEMHNPNLETTDATGAFLLEATAQGLVRFDALGEIEPALAQSWIVSDDGLRYTFRIRRASWPDGSRVTAEQVAGRVRAVVSRASRSPLKPVLGAIDDAVAMTDQVLEISLKGPRPNLLQLLAQPEMAIFVDGRGTGPYQPGEQETGAIRLSVPRPEDDEADAPDLPDLWLRGEPAAQAVARFTAGDADLVVGGNVGNLPFARAGRLSDQRLIFDPANGLFGLTFASAEGPLADPAVRSALSMAVDRDGLLATLAVPGLQPRLSLLPAVEENVRPQTPDWSAQPLPMRRELASRAISALDAPLSVRIAMPDGPGYRLVFAHLRRDWRLIGVEATRVAAGAPAELRLLDEVAPAILASWYLRHFACDSSPVCSTEADQAMEAARIAATGAERRAQLFQAHQLLSVATAYIPLTSPVRWSLVSTRLTGFRPNPFARHPAGTLLASDG
ncbi:ABC transporter substrate-binding protein [Sphingosinicella terrae]|uniref:ABC transporter substrate-binding protein n=1 Tax=Sphingosinicella terrae TaxID=2172047 RepID=UPI0013B44656|nr:ABC transporter substrate-binding protein [Sphingosinicella terrae]